MASTNAIDSSADYSYSLTHKTIGEIRGKFFVPSYQRGYRWDTNDVSRLLDDIWGSKGQEYSLQPIVVQLHRPGENESEHEWELIDGQQRLTTLYLILHYMQKQEWKKMGSPYKLRYETRLGSQAYLDCLDEASHATNIDYYHLYKAYQCIDAWFCRHGDAYAQEDAANTLHSYLFKSVRVIWYKAPASTVATELFTRLNIGRIPLTDAELIKAALLSSALRHSSDRAHEIAAQWDGIERDLHQKDIWAFVTGLGASDGDEKFPTRISLLLDTLADEISHVSEKRPRYHTFDTLRSCIELDFSAFWKTVVALHAQILGWTEQPGIYNKIGFLVASRVAFGELARTAKGKKKSEFDAYLVSRIRALIKLTFADLDDLNYEEKKSGYPKLLQLLLLLNVETITQAGMRFPFSRHVGQTWSLEHIHAQNAEILNKSEQWKTWLLNHKLALDAVKSNVNISEISQVAQEMESAISDIDLSKSANFSGEKFSALSARVLKILNHDDAVDHSIRNMALLSSRDNSRLNNSVFEVKRQMILELDRKGEYVPICTRNVFLKYYAEADAQQPHFWSEADKSSYIQEIRSRLKPYLKESDQSQEDGQ